MIGAVWGSGVDVAGDQATIAANKRWQSKLITTSGTFTVPSDVGVIWLDGCGGGGGGGGGNSTPGGGGGGGGAALAVQNAGPLPVVPGSAMSITIGAAGTAGAIDGDGSSGGSTIIVLDGLTLTLRLGNYGIKGGAVNGGGGGGISNATNGGTGGAGVGGAGVVYRAFADHGLYIGDYAIRQTISTGSAGGALSYAGGVVGTQSDFFFFYPTSTGNASGGGGGHGGHGPFGAGGRGGSNGAAIVTHATGYGSGGAGGSGNNPGGAGTQGFVRIYCFSATTI